MNLQQALAFVPQFASGKYTLEAYEQFVSWLEVASVRDLDRIADEQEVFLSANHPTGPRPSTDWIAGLERKLNRCDETPDSLPNTKNNLFTLIKHKWQAKRRK